VSKSLVIGFSGLARSGKDSCVDHLVSKYKSSKILKTSFAKKLRSEVHKAMHAVMEEQTCSEREGLRVLCEREGVEYEPFACRDTMDPFGKQRYLLQAWGMKRRNEHADYWVEKVEEEIASRQPDFVLISDLRFENEAAYIASVEGKTVRVNRPNSGLTGQAATHVSEHALAHYAFDYEIANTGTIKHLHQRVEQVFGAIQQTRFKW